MIASYQEIILAAGQRPLNKVILSNPIYCGSKWVGGLVGWFVGGLVGWWVGLLVG